MGSRAASRRKISSVGYERLNTVRRVGVRPAWKPRINVGDQRLFFPFPVVKIGIQHAAAISELQFSNSAFPNIHAGPPQQIDQFACIGANQSLRHLPIGRSASHRLRCFIDYRRRTSGQQHSRRGLHYFSVVDHSPFFAQASAGVNRALHHHDRPSTSDDKLRY